MKSINKNAAGAPPTPPESKPDAPAASSQKKIDTLIVDAIWKYLKRITPEKIERQFWNDLKAAGKEADRRIEEMERELQEYKAIHGDLDDDICWDM